MAETLNDVEWFDSLIAPKTLESNGSRVICAIGFNRRVGQGCVGSEVRFEAETLAAALRLTRQEYEFLQDNSGEATK